MDRSSGAVPFTRLLRLLRACRSTEDTVDIEKISNEDCPSLPEAFPSFLVPLQEANMDRLRKILVPLEEIRVVMKSQEMRGSEREGRASRLVLQALGRAHL